MSEPKQNKKASDEQKEYMLNYMEENLEFAHDKYVPSDAHLKNAKWQTLAKSLNSIAGASKDVNQWRKYWRDQKLHSKEKEALIKASFQRSGVNGVKKIKKLSALEERVLALLAPTKVKGENVPEMVIASQAALFQSTTPSHSQSSEPVETTEDKVNVAEIVVFRDMAGNAKEMPPERSTPTATRPRKRKKARSVNTVRISSFKQRIIKIEERKLFYTRKTYELQQKSLDWKKEYEGKLLQLREREIALQEKELDFKINNKQ